jgi:hypothetical protein
MRNEHQQSICTNSGHGPVDDLHSAENKGDKVTLILLTSQIGGVKHNRSLTVSKVFRLVASPGLKRVHCAAPAAQRQQRGSNGQ